MSLTILYIGSSAPSTTSAHRAYALQRLGHTVHIRDPEQVVAGQIRSVWNYLHYRTGYGFLQRRIQNWLEEVVAEGTSYDVVWVDSGELLGPKAVQTLKAFRCPIILYNIDDPTGRRDKGRFESLLHALPFYDLVVVVRNETALECQQFGAKQVLRVFRSYDEQAHQPFLQTEAIPVAFHSDVAFIGTWMRHEKRDAFLLELMEQGIPLSIWGDRWMKSPYWNRLQPLYKGGALGGRDYVSAIQGAKICLGFLSKGNRDLHTTRSLEIPYAGGLLCAERTTEHLTLYREGQEAAFWGNAAECATVCKQLLSDTSAREEIRMAGMQRVRKLQVGNEDVCHHILQKLNLS